MYLIFVFQNLLIFYIIANYIFIKSNFYLKSRKLMEGNKLLFNFSIVLCSFHIKKLFANDKDVFDFLYPFCYTFF